MQVEISGRDTIWGLVVLAALLVGVQQLVGWPGEGRLASGFNNAMHGPWFFVLTLVLIALGTRVLGWRRRWRTVLDILGLAFLAAVATEALQIFTERDAGWLDIGFDMLGAIAALALWASTAGLCRRWLAWIVASLALTVSLLPLLGALGILLHQRAIAPSLVDFDSLWWRAFTRTNSEMELTEPPSEWVGASAPVLSVELADTRWPGFRLHEPLPDWSGHRKLRVGVFITGEATLRLSVSIRLRETPNDHVYRNFDLAPGAHQLELDLTELFDAHTARVKELVIYSKRGYAGRSVLIDEVRLL